MVVYLDIILLLNFAIDVLLLWFTAFFRKEKIVWWRLAAAAAFGTAYVAFYFLPEFAGLFQWAVKLSFSTAMMWIAFGFRRLLTFLQNLCIFYFVAFVFGGGVYGLHYLLSSQSEVVGGILAVHSDSFGVGSKPTVIVVLSGFVLVYFLSRRSYHAISEPKRLEAFHVEVAAKVAGESVICRGLVDTGNQLYEPITRIPVTIMEARLFARLLPAELASLVAREEKLDSLEQIIPELPQEWQNRLRLVPFRSVSRGMDFLVAIKPETFVVRQNGRRFESQKVLIGLNPIPLAANGNYQAIVHPALLQAAAEEESKPFEQEG
ncbi:sigma-E processing peptidase SpoIIGA [Brevibacillus massiliensis]|uniref:sigma-E processing peptidase SpoIIGA n=1 Tax=Brevibacillus massiliensis TaxID=1118054 RepID=UPI00036ECB18|nr:sigma-E processing peptidase SpoIIGA [Brevibacillus massiliensis]